jgi:NAD(P)-dependent dehydrogenase (short-subunit alcohol dehydrogenase family)
MSLQKILITGGSQGIGLAIARDLAGLGHQLWLCARRQEVLQVAQGLGANVQASQVDVADAKSVNAVFSDLHHAWGGVDALIHAAAELGESGSFWNLAEDKFAATLMANTAGPFHVAKAFVRSSMDRPETKDVRRGKIILFAGGGAGYGYPRFLPYGTSKVAVVRMCETMAMELDAAQLPIDINVIAPGANETRMLAQVRAAGGEVRTVVPFSKPIALTRWLLSPDSDGVSGRFLHVNDAYPAISAENLKPEAFKLRRCE